MVTEENFQLRLRMYHREQIALGPGKVALLESIEEQGSIKQAAASMNMSYKRAWSLVRTMNNLFASPLVDASKGGEHGGGASLTETGRMVVSHYRAAEEAMLASQKKLLSRLHNLLSA